MIFRQNGVGQTAVVARVRVGCLEPQRSGGARRRRRLFLLLLLGLGLGVVINDRRREFEIDGREQPPELGRVVVGVLF